MKCVYLVVETPPYEGDINHGVFSTLAEAKTRLESLLTGPGGGFPKRGECLADWEIQCWPTDGSPRGETYLIKADGQWAVMT